MKKINIGYIFLIAICASNIWGNPADLDTSFNSTGYASLTFASISVANAIQDDGKIIAGGYTNPSGGMLVRYLSTGELDPGFGSGGIALITSTNYVEALTLQPDGKIVAVGQNNSGGMYVARYTTTGLPDTTFNGSGLVNIPLVSPSTNAIATGVAIQSTGNIIIAGLAYGGGPNQCFVTRYTNPGVLDTSFGTSGYFMHAFGTNDSLNSMSCQSNDNIVITGNTNTPSETLVARLTPSGSLDNSFNGTGYILYQFGSGIATSSIGIGVLAQSNGNIVITGDANISNISQVMTARFLNNGTLDTTFNSAGSTAGVATLSVGATTFENGPQGRQLSIDDTGKIVIAGLASIDGISNLLMIRYAPNGLLDTSFANIGYLTLSINGLNTQGLSLSIQSNGKLVTTGITNNQLFVARFIGGQTPQQPTSTIALYGQNSDYILDFLMVNFYAGVITDPTAQAATIAAMHTIIASYAADYVDQPNFNFISYLYLIEAQINSAQADLIFTYPDSTAQLNEFFVYINDQIATLHNL